MERVCCPRNHLHHTTWVKMAIVVACGITSMLAVQIREQPLASVLSSGLPLSFRFTRKQESCGLEPGCSLSSLLYTLASYHSSNLLPLALCLSASQFDTYSVATVCLEDQSSLKLIWTRPNAGHSQATSAVHINTARATEGLALLLIVVTRTRLYIEQP